MNHGGHADLRERPGSDDVEREIDHIRDLVTLCHHLAQRGATAAELAEYERTIDVARSRLAHLVRRASARYEAAA